MGKHVVRKALGLRQNSGNSEFRGRVGTEGQELTKETEGGRGVGES